MPFFPAFVCSQHSIVPRIRRLPFRKSALLNRRFTSLRIRLLIPILLAALLSAIGVAIGSSMLGNYWAERDLRLRAASMERTLTENTFPLHPRVLQALANLTRTHLIAVRDKTIISTTFDKLRPEDRSRIQEILATPTSIHGLKLTIGSQQFTAKLIKPTLRMDADRITGLLMLFDNSELRASRWRAALLPLITGLSTVVFITSVTIYLTNHLLSRLSRLQQKVAAVGTGDFELTNTDTVADEVGMLGTAVEGMATQLRQLWATVKRQQSEQLLHQIAGGMAHQLRNSLTGARMAVELHARQCTRLSQPSQSDANNAEDQEAGRDLQVALDQLDVTEQYVQRLLLIAKGSTTADEPAMIGDCLEGIRTSLELIAKHRRLQLSWQMAPGVAGRSIQDGPTLAAAVNNLVLNAFDAGTIIAVDVRCESSSILRVDVRDNGAGPDDALIETLFDPFVTSKPEGLGLGLPLVRRAAETLGGDVQWRRVNEQTLFQLTVQLADSHEPSSRANQPPTKRAGRR